MPSGPGGLAEGVVGPVAIEPGDAPFDTLAKAGKAAVLDDREVHGAHLAVAQHDVTRAVAPRNIVGLPGPEGGFVDPAVGSDTNRRIPEGALLLLKLRGDGRQRPFTLGKAPVIKRAGQPPVELQR